jgi:hypothetical protein
MQKILIAMIFVLCGVGTFAESPQTPTTPLLKQNEVRNPIRNSDQNQPHNASNEKTPFKVQIVPPPKHDPERNAYEAEQSHKTCMDRATIGIAVITAIILLIQAIAFFIQARRLSQTVKATEKAVKSTQNSERPYIFVELGEHSTMELSNGLRAWCCKYVIKNHGKTPAILTKLRGEVWYKNGQPPAPIKNPTTVGLPPGGYVVGVGNQKIFPAMAQPFKRDDAERMEFEFRPGVFCYGRVDYKDIFGADHHTAFCWEFQCTEEGKGFCLYYDNELNEYT